VAVAVHALWDFSLRIPAVAVVCAATLGLALMRSGHAGPYPTVPMIRRSSGSSVADESGTELIERDSVHVRG
jgi:hypothetical protein